MKTAKCVLIVAEDQVYIETLSSLIAQDATVTHQIFAATTVVDAIVLARNAPPDVIISDFPESDKSAFESFLRLKCALKHTPILIISGGALPLEEKQSEIILAFQKLGAGYMPRQGLTSEHLLQAMNALLQNSPTHYPASNNQVLFRTLFDNTNDAVLICNIDFTVMLANLRASELLGYSETELMGLSLSDLIVERERKRICENALHLLSGHQLPIFERTYLRKDGTEVITEVNGSVVTNEMDVPQHYLLIARDITMRKEAEAALKAERESLAQRVQERTLELQAVNEELNRVVRVKDQFVATVSHELRTPLGAVLNLSESIQEGIYGSITERQYEMLSKIRQSGQHLLALLNDILDISRIETHGLVLNREEVFIEDLCRNSLLLVQETARSRDLKLTVSNSTSEPMLIADERRLTQVIVNLLGNAIKFTPRSGMVGLEVYEGAPTISGRALNFTIWDTGVGIAAEEIPRLFQPFVQIQNHLSEHASGTGLGLALVDRLVKLHGGTVNVASELGKGSRFTVSLPWYTSLGFDDSLPVAESFADTWSVT